jgi:hypothetical protein
MQAQLTNSGTVLAWGAGDQGATHGKTMSMPKQPRVNRLFVMLCEGLLKFKPIADAPIKTPWFQQGAVSEQKGSAGFA